jgi:hypothetical protein
MRRLIITTIDFVHLFGCCRPIFLIADPIKVADR